MIFDSHAHYDDRKFDKDRDELLKYMHENGVEFILNSGESVRASKAGVELGKKYDFVYSASGIHPHYASDVTDRDLQIVEEIAVKNKKVVAIGEIGLDYHYDGYSAEDQKYVFEKQLMIAKKLDMPVIIHSRDAAQECFDMIKESGVRKGVIHCYSGSAEMAEEYVKMGFKIGVGGVVTYKNSKKLIETVERLSIKDILIETDSPYLAPSVVRGTRNDSSNLKYVVKKIAELKNMTEEEVAKITSDNAVELFFK